MINVFPHLYPLNNPLYVYPSTNITRFPYLLFLTYKPIPTIFFIFNHTKNHWGRFLWSQLAYRAMRNISVVLVVCGYLHVFIKE